MRRVIALVCLALLTLSCSGARVVDRVTIVNTTPYDLEVDVTGAARDGWLALGNVPRGKTGSTEQVVDLGQTWIFRFRHAGQVAGEVTVTRGRLTAGRWRVEVPAQIEEKLREMGFAPTPETPE